MHNSFLYRVGIHSLAAAKLSLYRLMRLIRIEKTLGNTLRAILNDNAGTQVILSVSWFERLSDRR